MTYEPLKYAPLPEGYRPATDVIDRAVHQSLPPMDDVGDDVGFMLDEKDPDGLDQHTLGAKLDAGKVDLTHLQEISRALAAVCRVFMFGEKKYTRGGWAEVSDGYNRYTKAMLRHIYGITEHVEELDPDAQIAWNALVRLELKLREASNGSC